MRFWVVERHFEQPRWLCQGGLRGTTNEVAPNNLASGNNMYVLVVAWWVLEFGGCWSVVAGAGDKAEIADTLCPRTLLLESSIQQHRTNTIISDF